MEKRKKRKNTTQTILEKLGWSCGAGEKSASRHERLEKGILRRLKNEKALELDE